MVWLHSEQSDLGPGKPSRWPFANGVREGGNNSPAYAGLPPRSFKVCEAQVRQWAVGDIVSLGFFLPSHSP